MRLRLPTGAELEVQGPRDFVEGESRSLLGRLEPAGAASAAASKAGALPGPVDWPDLIDHHGSDLVLRAKLEEGPLAASLLLILASEKLLGNPRPNATQLAKWVRASGHQVQRIDRLLAGAVRLGQILASGAKRSRRYELAAAGKAQALAAAQKLQQALGKP